MFGCKKKDIMNEKGFCFFALIFGWLRFVFPKIDKHFELYNKCFFCFFFDFTDHHHNIIMIFELNSGQYILILKGYFVPPFCDRPK